MVKQRGVGGLTAARQNERKDGSQLKAATLVNGATLQVRGLRRLSSYQLRGANAACASQVPGFVKEGDIVIVRPSTGEFVKRKL